MSAPAFLDTGASRQFTRQQLHSLQPFLKTHSQHAHLRHQEDTKGHPAGTFTTALDQSTNTIVRNTIFEEIPPAKCRFVRLTMTDWPHTTPLGIIEFTVFGRAAESLPAAQPVPRAR